MYDVISIGVPPVSIDNTTLLGERVIQLDVASCVVISVCNIIEAKHWQQSGIKLKFDYDRIYNLLNSENTGIFFDDIQRILSTLAPFGINYKRSLYCSTLQCRTADVFVKYLRSGIHKFQFATIGIRPLQHLNADNHAVTVCGYDADTFTIQTTYSTTSRFERISNESLFDVFVNFQCFDINDVMTN